MDQGQTYNPKCSPERLTNENLGFGWDGSTHSTHNTAKLCDWSVSNQEQISLVEMFSSTMAMQFPPKSQKRKGLETKMVDYHFAHTQGTNHHARNTSALLIHIYILSWIKAIRSS